MQPFSLQDKNKQQVLKQMIVLHVPIIEEKNRAKAMTIASKIKGVTNVAISKEKSHMVVIGEGVDSVGLANSLRKRLQFADIVCVKTVVESNSDFEIERQARLNCPTHERLCQSYDSAAVSPQFG